MCSTRLFKSLSSTHIVVVGLPLPQVFFVVLDSVNYADVLLWTKRYASVYGDTVLLAPALLPWVSCSCVTFISWGRCLRSLVNQQNK